MSRRPAKQRKQTGATPTGSTEANLFRAEPKPARKRRTTRAAAPVVAEEPVEKCGDMPRLALVRGDEDDVVTDMVVETNATFVEKESAPVVEDTPPLTIEQPEASEIDDDTWPWVEETSKAFEDLFMENLEDDSSLKSDEIEGLRAENLSDVTEAVMEIHDGSLDHSQAQDVILCEPPEAYAAMLELKYASTRDVEDTEEEEEMGADAEDDIESEDVMADANAREVIAESTETCEEETVSSEQPISTDAVSFDAPMPELPPVGEIVKLGISRGGVAPRRIGDGALIPAKLSWKPGDPFAGEDQPVGQRFRWELMLTAACITAVCGMGCVWLLRSVFA